MCRGRINRNSEGRKGALATASGSVKTVMKMRGRAALSFGRGCCCVGGGHEQQRAAEPIEPTTLKQHATARRARPTRRARRAGVRLSESGG